MEVDQEKAIWLNPRHPNFDRWRRGRNVAAARAQVVREIVSAHIICRGLKVLDLGSGEGGTSSLFAESNDVLRYDLSLLKLNKQQDLEPDHPLINGDAGFLPFRDSSFDLIILQDVIEHTGNRTLLIKELSRILNKTGIIYLSTPNKYSVLNIIADPHWGIPFLCLFSKPVIKKKFLRFFRTEDSTREDIAELLSFNQLKKLFSGYILKLKTREIISLLSDNPKGILWSSFHLLLYKILRKSGLFFILNKTADNSPGFINNFITPTFYIILNKKQN